MGSDSSLGGGKGTELDGGDRCSMKNAIRATDLHSLANFMSLFMKKKYQWIS